MVKAVVSSGQIQPLEPLPADWCEGQPLRIEKEEGTEMSIEEIDRDFTLLAKLCENSQPSEEAELDSALKEAHRLAKEQVRRQMGLSE